MVKIEHYNDDGANWQAQCVLAYLRSHYEIALEETYNSDRRDYDARLKVGRYENCREQGYVFSLCYEGNQRNYAVYEHRNSDNICVLISNQVTINTPSVDIMWADKGENATKYDYDKSFGYAEIFKCCNWIVHDMSQTISKWIEEKNL